MSLLTRLRKLTNRVFYQLMTTIALGVLSVPVCAQDSGTFSFGQIDATENGSGYGTDQNPTGYTFTVNINTVINSTTNVETGSCNKIYKLSYKIYDIDFDGEVDIYVNDTETAFIRATGEQQIQSRKIEFCGELLNSGTNEIEFRVDGSNRVWGVTDIQLKYVTVDSVNLSDATTDTADYGNGFGSNNHPDFLVLNLPNFSTDILFSVTGWDVDALDEISIYHNDTMIGNLTRICNNCSNFSDRFRITAQALSSGANQILLVQNLSNQSWGVTDLLVKQFSTTAPMLNLLLL